MRNLAELDTTPLNSPLSLFSAPCLPPFVKHCNENPLPCHPFPLKLLPTCENIGLPSHLRPTPPPAATARPHTRPTLPSPKSHVIPPGPHSSTAQKPRNINDPISKPETFSRELRAKLLSTCHGSTSRSPPRGLRGLADTTQHRRRRRCGGRRQGQDKHAHARSEADAWPARPGRASRRRAGPHPSDQAPPVWRAPEGPEGTGGLRDRPLRAKLACGDLAGGPPPTGTHSGPAHSGRPRGGRRSGGQSTAGDLAGPRPQQAAPRAPAAQ